MVACADYHDLAAGHVYRRVIDYEGGSCKADSRGLVHADAYAYHVSLSCNHCERPECVHVCPTGAMHKNELDLVCVDAKKCIGCGYCTMACPYHAPSIDPFSRQSSKCDGCSDRVSEGKLPICVEACPLKGGGFGARILFRQHALHGVPYVHGRLRRLPRSCSGPRVSSRDRLRGRVVQSRFAWARSCGCVRIPCLLVVQSLRAARMRSCVPDGGHA